MRKLSRRETLITAAASLGVASAQTAPREVRLPEARVGIIGLEGHTAEIFQAASAFKQIRVSAVADRDERQLARAQKDPRLQSARKYADYSRMLDAEHFDVVAVCGENATRSGIIRECAERKLPIVAEKPLALDLRELELTRNALQAAGVPFTMLLTMRFEPQYALMREVVASGRIGDAVALGAQKSYRLGERSEWMKSRQTYGGTIPYIGIHMVDLMRWISGREFSAAAAFQSNVGAPQVREMENNVTVAFALDNGGTASLRMDYLRPAAAPTHGDDRLRIAGTRGVIEYQQPGGLTLLTAAGAERLETPSERRFLIADFLESLYGGRKHVITPEEIFRVNEIVLRTRDAAETRTVVSL